jgi:hypothetical protein
MEAGIVRERESNDSRTGAMDRRPSSAEHTDDRSGGGKELDTPLSQSDVLALIERAHRDTTEESLKDMEGTTSASSGNDLLARAEQLGFDRGELRKAIVERVRENKKLDPLQSDVEREKEELGLLKDATAIDVAREQTVRKQVDELIGKFTSYLQNLTENGIKEGVNASQFSRKDYNLEVPEHVDGIPGDSYLMPGIAARGVAIFSATTFLCGLFSLDGVPSNAAFFSGWPAIVGGGMALIGSLWASFSLAIKDGTSSIDPAKPTSSPALNGLYAFCKNNGIKISTERTKDGKRQFVFDM